MKKFSQFIKESDNDFKITNLICSFDCPSKYYVEVPVKYSESDIQIYLDDVLMQDLPSEKEWARKLFFNNADNITDVHFEYDSIDEALGNNQKADLTWTDSYDSSVNDDDKHVMQINNMKYIIEFDKFNLSDITEDKVQETINTIFNSCVSNNEHEWSINISLNIANITFNIV